MGHGNGGVLRECALEQEHRIFGFPVGKQAAPNGAAKSFINRLKGQVEEDVIQVRFLQALPAGNGSLLLRKRRNLARVQGRAGVHPNLLFRAVGKPEGHQRPAKHLRQIFQPEEGRLAQGLGKPVIADAVDASRILTDAEVIVSGDGDLHILMEVFFQAA